jgi:hypothetical protein
MAELYAFMSSSFERPDIRMVCGLMHNLSFPATGFEPIGHMGPVAFARSAAVTTPACPVEHPSFFVHTGFDSEFVMGFQKDFLSTTFLPLHTIDNFMEPAGFDEHSAPSHFPYTIFPRVQSWGTFGPAVTYTFVEGSWVSTLASGGGSIGGGLAFPSLIFLTTHATADDDELNIASATAANTIIMGF